MSGAIGGAISGALVGSYFSPYGALIGAVVGGVAGALLMPPVNPDVSRPDVAELSAPTATEGDAIPDLVGTSQVGNACKFYWYANNRSEEVETEVGGGS